MTGHSRHFGRRTTVAVALVLGTVGAATAIASAEQNDDPLPEENACTVEQREGGYEDRGGVCWFTGWNRDGGWCLHQNDASVGRLGEGSCEPQGCVTDLCLGGEDWDGENPGGGGGGGGPGEDIEPEEFCLTDEEIPSNCNIWDFCASVGGDLEFVGSDPDGQVEYFECTVPHGWYECERHVSGGSSSCVIVHVLPGPTTTAPGIAPFEADLPDPVAAPEDEYPAPSTYPPYTTFSPNTTLPGTPPFGADLPDPVAAPEDDDGDGDDSAGTTDLFYVAVASADAHAVAEPGVTTTTAPTAAEQAGLR